MLALRKSHGSNQHLKATLIENCAIEVCSDQLGLIEACGS